MSFQFKKGIYFYWLGLTIFSLSLAITSFVLGRIYDIFGFYIPVIILAVLFIYSLFRTFKYKNQHLIFNEDGMDAFVVTSRGALPTKIRVPLTHVAGAEFKRSVLILINYQGQRLSVYNIVDAEKASIDINNFIQNHR